MAETQITETNSTTTTTTAHEPSQEDRTSSLLSDILAIIGFAILFIIIIWGFVHLVELIASSFSANKPAPTIQVNAPASATSGQPVTISWNYSPVVAGSYAFLYECENGLTFQMQQSTSTKSTIPCGVAYTTTSSNNSLSIIPILSATTSSATDTVSVVFIPQTSGSEVQGDATMAVHAATKSAPSSATQTSQKTTTYTSTNYSGPAELAVNIISGTINQYGDGTVTFNIANVGGSPSGSYTFSAQLPTAQPYPYQSPLQAPLAPGAHVVSTLNFTDAQSGGGIFSVTINGSSYTSSDYASMQITGPYNNYNNSQPYVQYPAYTY